MHKLESSLIKLSIKFIVSNQVLINLLMVEVITIKPANSKLIKIVQATLTKTMSEIVLLKVLLTRDVRMEQYVTSNLTLISSTQANKHLKYAMGKLCCSFNTNA